MRINNNTAAANASRNLTGTNAAISKNVEKLSTGLRINRAGDDASGLVISNQLRAQVSALRQASRNAQDGVSVLQTAEGALNEVSTMLNRMRDLAVQASNSGTNGAAARAAGQAEITALRTEIDRISSTTKFGSLNLLDGSFGSTGAKTAGFDADSSHVITAGTSNALTLTFGGTQAAALTNVSVALTAGTYTSSQMATELQNKLQSALAGGTAAQAAIADKVTVTSVVQPGGGSTLTVSVDGLSTGTNFTLTGNAVTVANATGLTTTVSTNATSSGGLFQVGANAGDTIALSLGSTSAVSLAINTVDVTIDDATTATSLDALDAAITSVSATRGGIGALQNRFESLISNLATTTENLQASESRIRDVDMATEMVEFTKNQVLSQAGTAMLAQANKIPEGILSLLRG